MTVASNSPQHPTVNGIVSSNGEARPPRKPRILICASSATGHTMPMVKIAEQLIERGYHVTFLGIEEFQPNVENIGATFKPIETIDINELMQNFYPEGWTKETLIRRFIKVFGIDPVASQMERLYAALEEMNRREISADSSDEIVILKETMFVGTTPLYYGGPPPQGFTQRPKIINIHAMSYMISSVDLPPFGFGLVPGTTPEERVAHQAMKETLVNGAHKEVLSLHEQEINRLGGAGFTGMRNLMACDILSISNDVCLQLSPPSLEYAISDLHPKVKMIGTLPLGRSKTFTPPSFWDEVTAGDKKLVVVTQGTVETNYSNLILPTLRALGASSDLLVVAILGKKGATLGDITIPDNARVIDYFAYDAILPYAAAFVFNAGYGGFIHGVVNGVPMVFAGATEEKPEVANRGEYAGVGIDLKTGQPTEQQLHDAVSKLLKDSRYKKRVVEVRKENEELNAMDTIERTILQLSSS